MRDCARYPSACMMVVGQGALMPPYPAQLACKNHVMCSCIHFMHPECGMHAHHSALRVGAQLVACHQLRRGDVNIAEDFSKRCRLAEDGVIFIHDAASHSTLDLCTTTTTVDNPCLLSRVMTTFICDVVASCLHVSGCQEEAVRVQARRMHMGTHAVQQCSYSRTSSRSAGFSFSEITAHSSCCTARSCCAANGRASIQRGCYGEATINSQYAHTLQTAGSLPCCKGSCFLHAIRRCARWH